MTGQSALPGGIGFPEAVVVVVIALIVFGLFGPGLFSMYRGRTKQKKP